MRTPTVAWAGHVITWGRDWWPAFLALTAALFAVPEGYAIAARQYGNTLSDFSRWQLGDYPGEPFWAHDVWWFASLAVWAVMAGWLTGHIWWGMWG